MIQKNWKGQLAVARLGLPLATFSFILEQVKKLSGATCTHGVFVGRFAPAQMDLRSDRESQIHSSGEAVWGDHLQCLKFIK